MGWLVKESEMNEGGMAAEGSYLAEVQHAEKRRSGAGDEMVNLAIVDAHTKKFLCYDNVMLEGKGAGIGAAKALSLGVAERTEIDGEKVVSIEDVYSWKGARFVVTLTTGEWKGKKRMEADFGAEGFGYAPESAWAGIQEEQADAPEDDSDIPF